MSQNVNFTVLPTQEATTISDVTTVPDAIATEATLAVRMVMLTITSTYNTPLSSETVYTRTRLHCAAICAEDYNCDVFEFYRQRLTESGMQWHDCVLHQVGGTGSETVNVDADAYAVL